MELTHLSLFSGIGGLDLAAEWAGFKTVGQCEYADYPTKVLEKHWPDVPRWKDVRELTAKSFRERTGIESVTAISGGFPCQPHSVGNARGRKASSDERDLWPDFRRSICEIRPQWVVAENVPGLLSSEDGRFFRGILSDFAEMGFNVAWGTYSAASIGAIHRRERMAIVAHSNSIGLQGWVLKEGKIPKIPGQPTEGFMRHLLDRADENQLSKSCVCGTDDGIPNRTHILKCLGNAVVPQQFYPIFSAIAEIERQTSNAIH